MANKYSWENFGKITTCNDLIKYLSGRELRHANYFHYTSLSAIDSILASKELWASKVSNFNDKVDSEQFSDNPEKYFIVCFSTGINENLPLWYMYSGIDGRGGRLRFSKSRGKTPVKNVSCKLRCKFEDETVKYIDLIPDKDYTHKFQDIIYQKPNETSDIVDLKYNTMTNHKMPKSEFKKFEKRNIGFCKGLIWFFEKETRLLITLTDSGLKKIPKNATDVKVALPIDNKIFDKLHIDLAPEITDFDGIDKYKHLFNFLCDSSNVGLSKYKGQIDMKLSPCKYCSHEYENKNVGGN